jgi:hypothetical protein
MVDVRVEASSATAKRGRSAVATMLVSCIATKLYRRTVCDSLPSDVCWDVATYAPRRLRQSNSCSSGSVVCA